ncbi:NUDIX domain-containing protein [Microbulbifer agarilyticus]|uniref:NUDIX domain-containing protein n=1 Tax=Microbulbifer sp. S227A TaxID=3415131 RepID=UPI001CD2E769|nr:NUDIX domain-containing protein [Microbulbifer agarilyticus]
MVAAVVEISGRYLVCKRPMNKHHGGLWEFPGGKVEFGESFSEALERELREELELEVVSIGKTIFSSSEVGSRFRINFIGVSVSGKPVLNEHEDYSFCSLSTLKDLPLAPVDHEFVLHLEVSQ